VVTSYPTHPSFTFSVSTMKFVAVKSSERIVKK
jgi:hypothetical protein